MAVVAKFFVKKVVQEFSRQIIDGESEVVPQAQITLSAVIDGGNEDWSKWTPSGEIEMYVTNPIAIRQFEPGRVYTVTFQKSRS